MFYSLIENKRNEWLVAGDCPVKELVNYIVGRGMMRDAQVEAIKTYLFLKIKCGNRPLWRLFADGLLNTQDLDELKISNRLREFLRATPAAQALYEYSILSNGNGGQLSPELSEFINGHYGEIDYEASLRKLFYDVDFADYIFSLPMGAGKTFLMAAFIYLDLYFAQNEPDNPVFSHNFLVLIPSGLKSSILDSLREIQEFDPSWVIPEPAATQLKRILKFEVLDALKSNKKSTIVRNPNAQKIARHDLSDTLMGLVAVVNAEKVILDRIEDADKEQRFFTKEEWDNIVIANELRDTLGRLPYLTLIVDEVHHAAAANEEIKLRKVINSWVATGNARTALGFSGTPRLDSAVNIALADNMSLRSDTFSNVVSHYPLYNALGNFLKVPDVKFHNANVSDEDVLREGVDDFLRMFGDTVYPDGCCAKLAIYCASIKRLEDEIYPIVASVVREHESLKEQGMDPSEVILKYHRGNKDYKPEPDAEQQFKNLDKPISHKRIVLLVQIGKEGWNCKSLTSIILPHRGAVPQTMVLQTSCRCLRQVTKGKTEPALIWLNKQNARVLNEQLQKQQGIDIAKFRDGGNKREKIKVERHSRMKRMNVPPIKYYQLEVERTAEVVETSSNAAQRLAAADIIVEREAVMIVTQDFGQNRLQADAMAQTETERMTFNHWLLTISKEGFGHPTMSQLREHTDRLRAIYDQIATPDSLLRPEYDHEATRSKVRVCFNTTHHPKSIERIKSDEARLLIVNLEDETHKYLEATDNRFAPSEEDVKLILEYDKNPTGESLSPEEQAMMERLVKKGLVAAVPQKPALRTDSEKSYHYMPYHFDSDFERLYFINEILPTIRKYNLECYYNGDDTLTGFHINCYEGGQDNWRYIGRYYPDFLVLSRKPDGGIDRVCIIETKGAAYADAFQSKKHFMEHFVKMNQDHDGMPDFDFLYIDNSMKEGERMAKTEKRIKDFFNLQ